MNRLSKFKSINNNQIFFSLCYCMLTVVTISCTGKIFSSENKRIQDSSELTDKNKLEYEFYLNDAIRHKLMGSLQESIIRFERCLEIFSGSDVAYFELGNIWYRKGEKEKAVQYLKKALIHDDQNKWYYIQLAQFYYRMNRINDAILIYNDLVDKLKVDVEHYYILAHLYFENHQYNEGLAVYKLIEEKIGIDFELISN